jgi:tetratricopeptide (TPR) repeat protein
MNNSDKKTHAVGYKKGDFIGQKYEVYDVLGVGGFGVVYLVYSHETKYVYALKTFRDEYLEDPQIRERFRKEAQVWIDLERHPYLVRAYFVVEISGRFFIVLEYIAPDERGLNSLDSYLNRQPPDITQSLRWAIQFCYGMEYAYSKGIRAHRDIKPANIMISRDKVVKISDFGLAGVIGTSKAISGIKLGIQKERVGLSCQTMEGTGFGTPTHMPPEQFTNAVSCDERSDIYSFGIVLYQMATSGKLPFLPTLPKDNSEEESRRFWKEMYILHSKAPLPKVNSLLSPVIQRCLEKEFHRRYRSFKELRLDLEQLLKRETGKAINPPGLKELEAWEWSNKGSSLYSLCRFDEAIICCNKALEIDPRDAGAWDGKGSSLDRLGRFDEAIICCNKALEIDPRHAGAWGNKGSSLVSLGRFDEAITCYNKVLEIDPRDAGAWDGKGSSLVSLGRFDEAILCYNKALEIDPRSAAAWSNKGITLGSLGRFDEAITCYNKALEIDPRHAGAWGNKGITLGRLGRFDEAIICCNKALEIDPRHAGAWDGKGSSLGSLGRFDEAITCYNKVLEIDPRDAGAWIGKGSSLVSLGRFDEAITCYNKALEIDSQEAFVYFSRAFAQEKVGRRQDAIRSYQQFIKLASTQYKEVISYAQQRLKELEADRNP